MFEPLPTHGKSATTGLPPDADALLAFDPLGSASRYHEEILEIADRIWLFDDLREAEISLLCAKMHCYAARRGQALLREGDSGDFLIIILTGEVSVIKRAEGQDKLIANVRPGAALGEMSLIDGMPRFATCIAREPTDFAVLSRSDLHDLTVLNPTLGNKVLLMLLQLLTRRLRDTSEKLLPFITGIPT